ncbi:MAG: hypothetical protein A2V88_12230 [Elusimicrobia bacterium RBG_16_66_12]|nr:MAG: hypothetical protein A2V88_12230 [Elusimicrobia bacterium RBG_16_66_12]
MPMLEAFTPPDGQSLRAAVLTTFDLDLSYLEQTVLPMLVGLDADAPDRTAGKKSDDSPFLLTLRSRLRQAKVAVLADKHRFNFESEKGVDSYDLLFSHRFPAFHPKLHLLAFDRATRLIVSSANLTEAGFHRNLELAWVASTERGDKFGATARSSLEYLNRIGRKEWPTSRVLSAALTELRRRMPSTGGDTNLLHSESAQPILHQWKRLMDGRDDLDELHVVSPFFDGGARSKPLTHLKARAVHVYVRKDAGDTGPVYRSGMSAEALAFAKPTCPVIHQSLTTGSTESGERAGSRVLHAKLFVARAGSRGWAMLGSPNFTGPGLLGANSEVAVALTGSWGDIRKHLPPTEGVVDWTKVSSVPNDDEQTGRLWTPFLQGAEYDALTGSMTIVYESRKPIAKWSVAYEDKVIARPNGGRDQFPHERRIRFKLGKTAWLVVQEGSNKAKFPIAVMNKELLPLVPGMADLHYTDILDYLASGAANLARFRDRVIAKRNSRMGNASVDDVPYMEQLSRLTRGLEGMRKRLSARLGSTGEATAVFLGDLGVTRLAEGIRTDRSLDDGFRRFALLELGAMVASVRWCGKPEALTQARRQAARLHQFISRNSRGMSNIRSHYLSRGRKAWMR